VPIVEVFCGGVLEVFAARGRAFGFGRAGPLFDDRLVFFDGLVEIVRLATAIWNETKRLSDSSSVAVRTWTKLSIASW
jgi:hypothetical protein